MKYHFIAVGGSVMHNLAIALKKKGDEVTGSDDHIFEPSRSRLAKYSILPEEEGWHPEKITNEIDIIILGMHAREDNPELNRARELGLKIYSFPEFLYEHAKNKKRIVIGGSHGKTTITSMIMHVLSEQGIEFDYMVGAQLDGFEVMVRLSDSASYVILEGDEYLTSPLDRRPKFHLYKSDIALISGIAWDHINVFPTFDIYLEQFRIFVDMISDDGVLIYCSEDEHVKNVAKNAQNNFRKLPYGIPVHSIVDGVTFIGSEDDKVGLQIFGHHNLLNLHGARKVCFELGVSEKQFNTTMESFKGASKRLELIGGNSTTTIYRDFAHAPSKLAATVKAIKGQYPDKRFVACMELHTYSSLTKDFISLYEHTMDDADIACIYYNPHTLKIKKLSYIDPEEIKRMFQRPDLNVFVDSGDFQKWLVDLKGNNDVILLMSSGDFDGLDFNSLI